MAKVVPANNAVEAASFLKDVVAPWVEKAGWKLQRVLPDGGSEFKANFDQACRQLNVKHTRTKPRHAWTNGFVERPQGTILHRALQLRAPTSELPKQGTNTLRDLLECCPRAPPRGGLKCQNYSGTGQPNDDATMGLLHRTASGDRGNDQLTLHDSRPSSRLTCLVQEQDRSLRTQPPLSLPRL